MTLNQIQGHTFTEILVATDGTDPIEVTGDGWGVKGKHYEAILFRRSDGKDFLFYHAQDCCEDVSISDVNGDWTDLLGTPILVAEAREEDGPPDDCGSSTWTFYTFRTVKGSVDVRWIGTSNGYYSESVSLEEVQFVS